MENFSYENFSASCFWNSKARASARWWSPNLYLYMKPKPTKGDKREIRQETRLTRPPRMEGKVKEAMMQPIRKPKKVGKKKIASRARRGYSDRQRKDYQLRSTRH